MSKQALQRKLAGNEAKVVVNRIRISPTKLNLVAGLIRGMRVSDALVQLTFSSKRIAGNVKKALQSAVANAENNHNLNVDELVVKEAYVGKSLVMKRMHTRGRGRSARIFKPFSNLTIVVREQTGETKAKPAKKENKTDNKTDNKEKGAKVSKKPQTAKSTKKEKN